jgi:hypothetical protein
MNSRLLKAKSWFLFVVMSAGLMLGCNLLTPAGARRSEDQAMLLMLASHSLIESNAMSTASAPRVPGLAAFGASWAANGPRRNEARTMADWYQALADKLPEDDEVKQSYLDKADEYYEKAKVLDAERERAERRRHRGFFRWFSRQVKNIGEGLGRVIGGTMGFAGAVVEYVIEEELPARIRGAIKGEWERLKAIAQGRIEMFWERMAARYGDLFTTYLRNRVDPLFIRLRDRITGRTRRNSRRLTLTAQALAQAVNTATRTPPALPTASPTPRPGRVLTMTGTLVPVGLNPGVRVTSNKISITFQDDGRGAVRGNAEYAAIYLWEECGKQLPTWIRWELTGTFDPATSQFTGTIQEYGKGQMTFTDCSVGDVPEYKNGEGGSWEAVLQGGVITGSITLMQSGGIPLKRVTFEAR